MALDISKIGDRSFELTISGKLDKADYERFVPMTEAHIRKHGEVNLLLHIETFRGWTPSALWEDLKFDVKHYRHVKRLAIVSDDEDTAKWLARLSKPFTGAEIAHFAERDIEGARRWIKSDVK